MTDEERRRHLSMLNSARRKRFVELHNIKQFKVEMPSERFEQINNALAERGVTKKQFMENAINAFLCGKI